MTSKKADRRKRSAWGMLVFALLGWPIMAALGLTSDVIIIVYSVVALVYPSILAIWFADDASS